MPDGPVDHIDGEFVLNTPVLATSLSQLYVQFVADMSVALHVIVDKLVQPSNMFL